MDLSYNVNGELSTISDPIGRVWTLLYYDDADPDTPTVDAAGPFVTLEHPIDDPDDLVNDYRISWEYTDAWDIGEITNKNDKTYLLTYVDGRLRTVTDPGSSPLEQVFRFYGTSSGQYETHYQDRRDNRWVSRFDGNGNLIWWEDPLDNRQHLAYEDVRFVHESTSYTNALNNTWTTVYDDAANVVTSSNPLGHDTVYEYDVLNNLESVTPPSGTDKMISYAYEEVICPTRPTKITLPADGHGNPAKDIELTYYGESEPTVQGLLETVTGPNGVGTLYEYDEYGQKWRTKEGALETSWTKVIQAVQLDAVGQVFEDLGHWGGDYPVQGEGGDKQCIVGGVIRLNSDGSPSYMGCGCVGGTGSRLAEDGPRSSSSFAGSAHRIPGLMRGSAAFAYNPMGQLTNAESEFNDTSLQGMDPWETPERYAIINYDELGRPDYAEQTSNEPSWNPHDRSHDLIGDPVTRVFDFDYDIVAGTMVRTGPDGQVTLVETDVAGRVTSVTRDAMSVGYAYRDDGRVQVATYGNGSFVSYQYDDAGRPTLILHTWGGALSDTILRLDYAYTIDGLIETVAEMDDSGPTATTTYTYDNRNRLIAEQRVAAEQPYHLGYTYDQGGNRLVKTDHLTGVYTEYYYDVDDEDAYESRNNRLMYYEVFDGSGAGEPVLLEVVTYEYGEDDLHGKLSGNPTHIVRYNPDPTLDPVTDFAYHSTTLQYNSSGELWFLTEQKWTWAEEDYGYLDEIRITRATEFRGSGRQRYLRRQRVGGEAPEWRTQDLDEVEPGSTVWSDYDGNAIYGDYEVVFTEVADDVWSKEIVETTAYLPGIAQMDSVTGEVVYFHTDQIGTVRAITSSSASRPHFLVSTAFGERVHVDGTVGTRYQYAGAFGYETLPAWDAAAREYLDDEDVPFLHVGYRYYNPETGRFLQRDPIGIRGGLNTYAYCENNPIILIDPSGLCVWVGPIKGIITVGGYVQTGHGILTADSATKATSVFVTWGIGFGVSIVAPPVGFALTCLSLAVATAEAGHDFITGLDRDRNAKPSKPFDFDDPRFQDLLDRQQDNIPGGICGGIFTSPTDARRKNGVPGC